jgi:HSF-type DNA-binding
MAVPRLFLIYKPHSHASYSLSFSCIETYELIRTCDPAVACWSDDGETFIVKDPVQFETTVIPQFFKHNKFTSFVRVRLCVCAVCSVRSIVCFLVSSFFSL